MDESRDPVNPINEINEINQIDPINSLLVSKDLLAPFPVGGVVPLSRKMFSLVEKTPKTLPVLRGR